MSTKLTLLQYNVNKSREKVLIGLLEEREIVKFDILAIQEPWRNTSNGQGYNPSNSPFYLIQKTSRDSERARTAIYVNKRIPKSQISEIYKEKDLISLRMSTTKEDIYIHNLYIEPLPHSTKDLPPILAILQGLLKNKGRHIILGDFNLHHPLWNDPTYDKYHYIADNLLDIVSEIGAVLYTPKGLKTRNCQRGIHHEKTTIDLLFSNIEEIETIPRISENLEQSSDHLPIETTFRIGDISELSPRKKKRLWNSLDSELFLSIFDRETLYLANLSLNSRESIDYYISLLTKAISLAMNIAIPYKRGSPYDKGFWNQECRNEVLYTR